MTKIILTDGDPLFRESVASYIQLKVPTAEVEQVETAHELAAKVIAGDYDLVLTNLGADARVPIEVGGSFTAIRQMRAAKPDVPIYVISAYSQGYAGRSALNSGATGYIYKGDIAGGISARQARAEGKQAPALQTLDTILANLGK